MWVCGQCRIGHIHVAKETGSRDWTHLWPFLRHPSRVCNDQELYSTHITILAGVCSMASDHGAHEDCPPHKIWVMKRWTQSQILEAGILGAGFCAGRFLTRCQFSGMLGMSSAEQLYLRASSSASMFGVLQSSSATHAVCDEQTLKAIKFT